MIVAVIAYQHEGDHSFELARFVAPDVLGCLWELKRSLTGVDLTELVSTVAEAMKRDG